MLDCLSTINLHVKCACGLTTIHLKQDNYSIFANRLSTQLALPFSFFPSFTFTWLIMCCFSFVYCFAGYGLHVSCFLRSLVVVAPCQVDDPFVLLPVFLCARMSCTPLYDLWAYFLWLSFIHISSVFSFVLFYYATQRRIKDLFYFDPDVVYLHICVAPLLN